MDWRNLVKPRRIATLAFVLASAGLAVADSGPNHRVSTNFFGVSGGNVNHRSRAFCCGGTLGSLLTDGIIEYYILSNNHILARTDSATLGEDITQPGLIDNSCRPAEIVADLSKSPALGTNVDAAIAALRPGAMDLTGAILDVGTISGVVRSPSVGLAVQKSGRTTGHTTASVGAINASVNVQYQKGCGTGRKFVVSYINQIVVEGSGFSAGGDSGSLIVANDACKQPVGLLFAGSSTTTIGNPAGEVLTKTSAALGSSLSFVGDSCTSAGASGAIEPSSTDVTQATQVKNRHAPGLMANPAVMAVGVGANPDNPSEAVIKIYVERGQAAPPIPDRLEGVGTRVVFTDRIVAYAWNMPEGLSCSQ